MTPKRVALYIDLLKEIQRDGYVLPDAPGNEAWDTTRETFSGWAPELVITKQTSNGPGVLLAPYAGKGKMAALNGQFHLPGGYHQMTDVNIAEACNRIAERELGVGVFVPNPYKPLWTRWWNHGTHPTGRPFSVFLEAWLLGQVKNPEWKFYLVADLPKPMVQPHEEFINRVLIRR